MLQQHKHQNRGKKVILVTSPVVWLLVPEGLGWVFQKLLISRTFHTQQSQEFIQSGAKNKKHPFSSSFLSGNTRLVWANRKPTGTQGTTLYNISERRAHQILTQLRYNGKRPHWVTHLPVKHRNLRLHWALVFELYFTDLYVSDNHGWFLLHLCSTRINWLKPRSEPPLLAIGKNVFSLRSF